SGDNDHRLLTGQVRQNAGLGKKWLQVDCLNPALHRHFMDHDRKHANESLVETSLPSVLLTMDGSSVVRGSPPAVHRNSVGVAISFRLISPL
ncbi:hypothetical protein HAX54_038807, partial [Datura stramonium]|nr:hypothetical protein [Datura stramonium]